jgi:hypothetical protein
MKKSENIDNKMPKYRISKRLSTYDTMPLFQDKVDKANAFFAKNPPFEAMKILENEEIKDCFMKGKSIEQIAVLMQLSEEEIGIRLKDLGLLEKVGV